MQGPPVGPLREGVLQCRRTPNGRAIGAIIAVRPAVRPECSILTAGSTRCIGLTRQLSVALLGAAALVGFVDHGGHGRKRVAQPAVNAAGSAEKELEVAAARVREGKIDEAFALSRKRPPGIPNGRRRG